MNKRPTCHDLDVGSLLPATRQLRNARQMADIAVAVRSAWQVED